MLAEVLAGVCTLILMTALVSPEILLFSTYFPYEPQPKNHILGVIIALHQVIF